METFVQQFIEGIRQTGWLEYVAVIAGIASVWYSKKEDILVYPVGLVNTLIYIYISMEGHLLGEASVNMYYTIVSIYGWIAWAKRDPQSQPLLHIRNSSPKEMLVQTLFFGLFYILLYTALTYLQKNFAPGAIPWADAFASASAYTAMWLMARKRVESWYWWIITNIASIPLYFSKGYVVTSGYYVVLLIIAFFGLDEWRKKAMSQSS